MNIAVIHLCKVKVTDGQACQDGSSGAVQASKWIAYITVKPQLGKTAAHNSKVVYSLDFRVTPHQLRHTYITNLIHASVDPKTVQYLAGHEKSKITMDVYAKVKYNRPEQLLAAVNRAFGTGMAVS